MSKLDKLKTLIPIHLLEWEAKNQIYSELEHDFLLKMAIMPDCHKGYTLPIGGVALLDNVISPEYVGYDQGCGMCYLNTHILVNDIFPTYSSKLSFFEKIYERVPAGVGITQNVPLFYHSTFKSASSDKTLNDQVNANINIQLGTLGSGNHFIEIGVNRKDEVTISIHSGSRKPGWDTANYYMKLSRKVDTDLPKGFLHLNGEYGQQFLQDLNFMLNFALDNRQKMMTDILTLMGFNPIQIIKMIPTEMVNENHNHAIVNDDGTVLHRKGATPSIKDQLGIIPGSMKSGVYLTKGLGNDEYLSSSSHGAGRKMSRTQAKTEIQMKTFEQQMNGIVARVNTSTIDEAPDAYKNLNEVIEMQEGIVLDIVDYSYPIINVKG